MSDKYDPLEVLDVMDMLVDALSHAELKKSPQAYQIKQNLLAHRKSFEAWIQCKKKIDIKEERAKKKAEAIEKEEAPREKRKYTKRTDK